MLHIWGEGRLCVRLKKFGSWDQNLMTEAYSLRWSGSHDLLARREEVGLYLLPTQNLLIQCEVAAMIEGLLRHCTDMKLQKNYVDTHGQSEIAFAFLSVTGLELLPRIKWIHEQNFIFPSLDKRYLLKPTTDSDQSD